MSGRPVVCPACRRSSDKGDDFEVIQPYRATWIGGLAAVDDDDTLLVDGWDGGDPEAFGSPEIACECGHQWRTRGRFATSSGGGAR